jgi:type IV pili sensor histidine kinase/response regulator
MAPNATPEQLDPLAVVVKVSFNSHITTVGEALDHLLLRSGYRMAALKASDPNMQILISRDLPEVHRKLGPITLTNALKTLSGPAWELVVDPVNRLISFDLIPEYRTPSIVGSAAMPNNTLVAEVSAKGE